MESDFEWDPAKDAQNQRKHGVSFGEAQLAFMDVNRVIAKDSKHSQSAERFYCIGRVALGVLTVRLTYRNHTIRIFGAGFWVKGKNIYEAHRKVHE